MDAVTARTSRAALAIIVMMILPRIGHAQSPSSTPEPPRGIEVQPAQVERDLSGRSFAQTLTYFNHTDTERRLTLNVRELWNARDTPGASRFATEPTLQRAFTLDRSTLTIPAGGKGAATLSGTIPAGWRSAYPAVVAVLPHGAGTSVQAEFQLASQFLLRGPKPWEERISVTDVGIIPDAGKSTYTVFATVKNTGNVHVRPRGRVEIRRSGALLATVSLPLNPNGQPFAILPTCGSGCTVRLQATWAPREPVTGAVDLTAVFTDPSASLTRTAQLSSGTVGTLSGSISITSVSANSLVATIRNDGGVTLSQANVRFAVRAGPRERGRKEFPQASLDPGMSRTVNWQLDPALPDGRYVITAELLVAERSLSVATTTLRLGPVPGGSREPALIAAGLLLVLVAAIFLYLLWKRRRDDQDDRARNAAR